MTKRNNLTILVLILMLIVLPLVLLLTRQRQEIRKHAAENDAVVLFGSSASITLAPGASINGAVNITAGATSISSANINLIYDPAKLTITNFSCGTKLATPANPVNTAGNLVLSCLDQTSNPVSSQVFTAATFTVTASSTLGSTTVTLGDLTKAYHGNTLITLNKNNGTVQIATAGSGGVLNFFFGSSAVSPGGTNTGVVKIAAGTTAVKSSQIVLSYDASKMTVSNLRCGSEFSTMGGAPYYSSGTSNITCAAPTGNTGISGRTFDAALFDIQIPSGAAVGNVTVNFFAPTTGLSDQNGSAITATLNSGTFQITQAGGATPTPTAVPGNPSITSLTPACGPRGTIVTAAGANLGTTTGSVCFDGGYGCTTGANVTSWNTTQVKFTVPEPIRDAEYNRNFSVQIKMPGSGTAISTIQTFYVSNNCGAATPTPTVVVTPTPTVNPNAPGILTLTPSSTTVGSAPVLVEIKVNSGGRSVSGVQAVVNVDSKLSVTDSSGNAASTITSGDVPFTVKIASLNKVVSNKITYYATKDGGTNDQVVNGTLAKFYVKTSQTSGTATLSFQTGTTENDSFIQDSSSVNVLGSAQPLTLKIGTVVTGPSFSIKLKLAGVESKPTTPANVTGVDYGHLKANIMLKTGDTVILGPTNVTLTPDTAGLYTSELIALGSAPAGTYALYVKPEKHYQKRFSNTTVPSTAALDLTANAFRFGPGDLNQDGTINAIDIGIVLNAIAKQDGNPLNLNATDFRADVDYTGFINGGDTMLIFDTINTRFDEDH